MARARSVSAAALLLVILGGAAGVAARAALTVPFERDAHPLVVPAITLGINIAGSFVLGLVVGWLGERHPRARLFLGTGVLGGFTTHSSFAVQSVTTSSATPAVGVGLIIVSVFGGVIAAAIGLRLAARRGAGGSAAPAPEEAE